MTGFDQLWVWSDPAIADSLGWYRAQYSTLTLPAGGFIAKVSFDGSGFLEVATLGTQTFISHGRCRAR